MYPSLCIALVAPSASHAVLIISCFLAAVLLIKAAQEWQKQHGSKLPSNSSQRTEFKDLIKSWQRQIEGVPLEVLS